METASSVAHKQSPEAAIRTNNTKKKRLLGRWPYALMGLLLLAVALAATGLMLIGG